MLSKHTTFIKAGLEGCFLSGVHHFARPLLGGLGAILTLHRVRPRHKSPFQPNRALEITPEFFDATLNRLRAADFDIVDLDEALRRLSEPGKHRRFVVITFDGAYRDVKEHAYPILQRHNCPFTVYVPTAFPDGQGLLWHLALEKVIAQRDAVRIEVDGEPRIYMLDTLGKKYEAFEEIGDWLRSLDAARLNLFMKDFCARYHFDMPSACREACMSWADIATLAADPLATIGAQSVDHAALSKMTPAEINRQMRESARVLEAALGEKPRHFAYPYGDSEAAGGREFIAAQELGFATAVTTRAGLLYPDHFGRAHALPRVALSGDYQAVRYLDVLLSGLPFYVWNGFERVSA